MDEASWITVKEAGERFGTHKVTTLRLARNGILRFSRLHLDRPTSRTNPILIWSTDLEEYLIEEGRHPDSWPDQRVPKIVGPLSVFGHTNALRSDQVGNVGEFLVAYYLSFAGVSVSLVDRRGMDHFVRMPNGSMFALEVKTASKPKVSGGERTLSFGCRRLDADWFAFLDLSTNVFILRPVEEVGDTLAHKFFTPFYMNQSIQRLFNHYGDEPHPIRLDTAA
jgi:hypothetical protein